jgi:hypothetical protein
MDAAGGFYIEAVVALGAGRGSYLKIIAPTLTGAGSTELGACGGCAIGSFSYGIGVADPPAIGGNFTDGTLTITAAADGRIRGSFSGRIDGTTPALIVSDGYFNIPLRTH